MCGELLILGKSVIRHTHAQIPVKMGFLVGTAAYFTAPFSQAWNVRLRSLSNDSLVAVVMISATEIEARALRHCVSASRKAFVIGQRCLHAAGAAAHGPR